MKTRSYGGLAVVLIVFTMLLPGCGSGTMSKSESDARDGLRALGALTVLDGNQVHCATVTMNANLAPELVNDVDEAIKHVANLPYLTHLEVTNLPVTDAHLATISGLGSVNSLVLTGTQVTDQGLQTVSKMPLDALYVDDTKLSSGCTDILAGMSKLEILDISGLDVVGNLTPLAKLEKLQWLILDNVTLDSAAIDALASLPTLGRLTIANTTVSDADIAKLKSAKPSLMVDRGGAQPDAASQPPEAQSTAE